jgi:RHS repeat-associated protein
VAGSGVSTREFDSLGNIIQSTNPVGRTTTWERDDRGRILSILGPLADQVHFVRDQNGEISEVHNPDGGVTQVWRDRQGGLVGGRRPDGSTVSVRRDARGNVVERIDGTGNKTEYTYDSQGNLAAIVQPSGGRWQLEYDALGRTTALKTPDGGRHEWEYDANGRKVAERLPNGAIVRQFLSAHGELISEVNADGYVRNFEWRGFESVTAQVEPSGAAVKKAYNREGWLTHVINEHGEDHQYVYNLDGFMVGERTFDGRTHTYQRDLLGNVERYTDSAGKNTDFERNAVGQVTSREFHDGSRHDFSYDISGRLTQAESPSGATVYERDHLGNIVREVQTIEGLQITIERRFDGESRRTLLKSSLGLELRHERNRDGYVVLTEFNGSTIRHRRDALGRETVRELPSGGKIQSDYDELGWLRQRGVSRAALDAAPATTGHQYVYSAGGLLRETRDFAGVPTVYTYDHSERLIETQRDGVVEESFTYDHANNINADFGVHRQLGAGNRLLARGATKYEWDADGRLAAKTTSGTAGSLSKTRYIWDDSGMLSRVELPDGVCVVYKYDFLGRRVVRLRESLDERGQKFTQKTVFVWDGLRLLHEVEENEGVVSRVRSYYHDDSTNDPAAVHETGSDIPPRMAFHVTDHTGAVLQLVDGRGNTLLERARLGYSLKLLSAQAGWSCLFGLPGQQVDEDTGLAYNWFRFYEPDTGRYISPDLLELSGGINVYAYSANPLRLLDLYGLTHYLLNAFIRGTDGSERPVPLFDSTQTGKQYEGVLAQMTQVAGNSDGEEALKRQACHTEQKESWEVVNGEAANRIGEGETLVMEGTEPPCSNCKGAMNRLAFGKKCNVEYRWRDKDTGQMRTWSTDPRRASRSSSVRRWRQAGLL